MFALHPLYLSLADLVPTNMPVDIAKSIAEAKHDLDGPAVDYERTVALKLALARRIFDAAGHAELQVSCVGSQSEAGRHHASSQHSRARQQEMSRNCDGFCI